MPVPSTGATARAVYPQRDGLHFCKGAIVGAPREYYGSRTSRTSKTDTASVRFANYGILESQSIPQQNNSRKSASLPYGTVASCGLWLLLNDVESRAIQGGLEQPRG